MTIFLLTLVTHDPHTSESSGVGWAGPQVANVMAEKKAKLLWLKVTVSQLITQNNVTT
jgi:hypothetical protein